jgi:hypothetical protein
MLLKTQKNRNLIFGLTKEESGAPGFGLVWSGCQGYLALQKGYFEEKPPGTNKTAGFHVRGGPVFDGI